MIGKEVLITGRGLVTPLGIGLEKNEEALRHGESGVVSVPDWKERGLESAVGGVIDSSKIECPLLNKKNKRYMTDNAIFAVAAAYEAFNETGLDIEELKNLRVAVVIGNGGTSQDTIYSNAKILEDTKKSKRVTPFVVPKVMSSSAVASLSLVFGITGESYCVGSACASGAHAITVASRLIAIGLYDIVLTGGTEELSWVQALGFDAMRAISRGYNDRPKEASRPFDSSRDGFVIASGAGMVVLESAEHAKSRNAQGIAKISGTAANSNGVDMVVPDQRSCTAVMNSAIENAGLKPADIDYINTHGTATPIGDPIELRAIGALFDSPEDCKIAVNSTKSQTGHMIGAAGAAEIIFCSMMLAEGFISPTINLQNIDPEFSWTDIVLKVRENIKLKHVLNNSFGFGGTNSSVILSAVE